MPTPVQHQHVLVLPRPRLRSCRRPFSPSPAPGPYRLPHAALERLLPALAPARNREAALTLAVFLARYWTSPARLGQAFPIDRRALCGHRDLPLTEARVRGAIRALEEIGFLERVVPEPGRRYQRTPEGLHRQPLAFHFGAEFQATFEAANKRPRRGPGTAQDGRRPLPTVPPPAAPSRPSWSPPEARAKSPKSRSEAERTLHSGDLARRHSRASLPGAEPCRDAGSSRLEEAIARLGQAIRGK